jgi:hypothetical protein
MHFPNDVVNHKPKLLSPKKFDTFLVPSGSQSLGFARKMPLLICLGSLQYFEIATH